MLGRLCRWLRILGYDTEYSKEKDNKLVKLSQSKTLLTRDKNLAKRAEKVILIRNNELTDQLRRLKNDEVITIKLNPDSSRCPKCNGEIQKVKKGEIRNKEGININYVDEAWKCKECNQIYWEGRQWKTMNNLISNLRKNNEEN